MPHTLLLRLPAPGEQETEWLSIEDSGAPSTARQRGPLSLAAAVARSARVVALAPASHILLAEPELPPGSGVKLARAVPFALEEQLTEDVDQLSFSIGRRRPGGPTAAHPWPWSRAPPCRAGLRSSGPPASIRLRSIPISRSCRRIPDTRCSGSKARASPCAAPAHCRSRSSSHRSPRPWSWRGGDPR